MWGVFCCWFLEDGESRAFGDGVLIVGSFFIPESCFKAMESGWSCGEEIVLRFLTKFPAISWWSIQEEAETALRLGRTISSFYSYSMNQVEKEIGCSIFFPVAGKGCWWRWSTLSFHISHSSQVSRHITLSRILIHPSLIFHTFAFSVVPASRVLRRWSTITQPYPYLESKLRTTPWTIRLLYSRPQWLSWPFNRVMSPKNFRSWKVKEQSRTWSY